MAQTFLHTTSFIYQSHAFQGINSTIYLNILLTYLLTYLLHGAESFLRS